MVTTFLTSDDFQESAASLDYRRAGKQRTEAYQIILLHQDLDMLGLHFNIKKPQLSDYSDEVQWFLDLQTYREADVQVTYNTASMDQVVEIPKDIECVSVPASLSKSVRFLDDDTIQYKNKIYQPQNVFFAVDNQRLITLGYVNNPTTRMWLGYTECLCEYLNVHIQEWIHRGYKNNMELMKVSQNPRRPFWLTSVLLESHRAVLYQKKPEYYTQWSYIPYQGYLWPTKLSVEKLQNLDRGETVLYL